MAYSSRNDAENSKHRHSLPRVEMASQRKLLELKMRVLEEQKSQLFVKVDSHLNKVRSQVNNIGFFHLRYKKCSFSCRVANRWGQKKNMLEKFRQKVEIFAKKKKNVISFTFACTSDFCFLTIL